jgi:hypothetical protein
MKYFLFVLFACLGSLPRKTAAATPAYPLKIRVMNPVAMSYSCVYGVRVELAKIIDHMEGIEPLYLALFTFLGRAPSPQLQSNWRVVHRHRIRICICIRALCCIHSSRLHTFAHTRTPVLLRATAKERLRMPAVTAVDKPRPRKEWEVDHCTATAAVLSTHVQVRVQYGAQ